MDIKLDGIPETLLIPLWARAEETKRENPIVSDELALSMIETISYDFSKFSTAWMSQVGVAIRTMILDREITRFIETNKDAVIINIGAGLDTRCQRLQAPFYHWYDLDLADVIELRKHFFQTSEQYTMIGKSVFDYSWIDQIIKDDKPVLFIAEGTLMYFNETDVRDLLNVLAKSFPSAEMLFETITPFLVNRTKHHDSVKYTSARFKWGIYNGKRVESYGNNITFLDEWNYFDFHQKRWKWLRWPAKIPLFRKRLKSCIVHVAFAG